MTVDEAKQKLVAWCLREVGTHEGANNYNKYAADPRIVQLLGWNAQYQPWCDIFTDEAFIDCFSLETGAAMTYQPIGGGSALCRTSAQFFQDAGAWNMTPEVGDVVFFYASGGINHQGIVVQVAGNMITTVEGNSSDSVAKRTCAIGDHSIAGFGRPKWDLVAEPEDSAASDSDTGDADAGEDPGAKPSGSLCWTVLPVLQEGDTGTAVDRLQTLLIRRGYYCGGRKFGGREVPDGEFGPATAVAVRDLQLSAGLGQTGAVEDSVWTALITT